MAMSPASMRRPPNQYTPMLARFIMTVTEGMSRAKRRPMDSDVAVNSSLAAPNTPRRSFWRTKARMTRTPWICSRMTRLTRSIRSCMTLKWGRSRPRRMPTTTSRSGMRTRMRPDRGTSTRSAMKVPPMSIMGAMSIMAQTMKTTIWICWMSLVERVTREGAPNRETSSGLKRWTWVKMSLRMRRPRPMAARALR